MSLYSETNACPIFIRPPIPGVSLLYRQVRCAHSTLPHLENVPPTRLKYHALHGAHLINAPQPTSSEWLQTQMQIVVQLSRVCESIEQNPPHFAIWMYKYRRLNRTRVSTAEISWWARTCASIYSRCRQIDGGLAQMTLPDDKRILLVCDTLSLRV